MARFQSFMDTPISPTRSLRPADIVKLSSSLSASPSTVSISWRRDACPVSRRFNRPSACPFIHYPCPVPSSHYTTLLRPRLPSHNACPKECKGYGEQKLLTRQPTSMYMGQVSKTPPNMPKWCGPPFLVVHCVGLPPSSPTQYYQVNYILRRQYAAPHSSTSTLKCRLAPWMGQHLFNVVSLIHLPVEHAADEVDTIIANSKRDSQVAVHDLIYAVEGVLFVDDGIEQNAQCPNILFFALVGFPR